MDVFNVASKQTAQASQVTTSTSVNPKRMVERPNNSVAAQKDQSTSKDEINKKLDSTVKALNDHMESLDTNVTFGFNDKIQSMFVDVIEKSTGKIIRTIPTEEAMKLSEKMKEIVGMIFDKKG